MILVTGGTGFIGSRLVAELMGKGYEVRLLARSEEKVKEVFPKADRKFDAVKGDLFFKDSIEKAMKGVDVVVHLAGLVSYSKPEKELFMFNQEATKNLMEFCGDVDKIVLSSSVAVYGPIKKGEVADEGYPTNPINAYGRSKLAAEGEVVVKNAPFVILRTAPVYGRGSPSWLKNLQLLDKGFPVPKTDSLTHVTHIDNAVQAFIKAIEKKKEGTFNIADKDPVKFVSFAQLLVKHLGRKPKVMPMGLVKAAARLKGMSAYLDVLTMNRYYNIGKAIKQLDYKPSGDIERNIQDMVDWYKETKPWLKTYEE